MRRIRPPRGVDSARGLDPPRSPSENIATRAARIHAIAGRGRDLPGWIGSRRRLGAESGLQPEALSKLLSQGRAAEKVRRDAIAASCPVSAPMDVTTRRGMDTIAARGGWRSTSDRLGRATISEA